MNYYLGMLRRAFLTGLMLTPLTALAQDGVIRYEDLSNAHQYMVYLDGHLVSGCVAVLPGAKGWVECYDLTNLNSGMCPIHTKHKYGHVVMSPYMLGTSC